MAAGTRSDSLHVVDVALDARIGGRDAVYTYLAREEVPPGTALLVPLGSRSALGYAVRYRKVSRNELGFPVEKLRPAIGAVDGLGLPAPVMRLVEFVASEYLCPLSLALGAACPPGGAKRLEVRVEIREDSIQALSEPLTAVENELVAAIRSAVGGKLALAKFVRSKRLRQAIDGLKGRGVLRETPALKAETESHGAPLLRLTPEADRVEAFLKKFGKRKPAQALTVMRMREVERAALTPADIKSLCGVTDATIQALIQARLLERHRPGKESAQAAPEPNAQQRAAIDAIASAIRQRRNENFLVFGVTGSGKTEVYLRAVAEALRQGRQALYLVPEIALATQAVSHLRERFGDRVAVLHSDLPERLRFESWAAIRSGQAVVAIGARSAVFAPLTNVGVVIVDEEHEAGYKQESAPRYHAARLAEFLAREHGCPAVFGSATPSAESFHAAREGRLRLLSLPHRAAKARLPEVEIVDLAETYRAGKPAMFSDPLLVEMTNALQSGRQVILFLNRRSYAPFLLCRDCGKSFRCPRCAVSLAYSLKLRALRCHHCDYRAAPPESCPQCGGSRIRPFGIGTERVEEAVREAFPGVTVARLDRDVSQKRGKLEEVLADFARGATQVLVGTQMVAKGLNFPNVTVVGVVAADVSLNIPDFRSSERTFQLLSQVAGRAGRGASPGTVIIQTLNPEHPAITCARDHDVAGFLERVLRERADAGYPPFRRLVNVVVTSESRTSAIQVSTRLRDLLLPAVSDGELLGPADCAIERLHGKWRRHLLIKLPPGSPLGELGRALHGFEPGNASIVVDVDPQSLM